MKTNISIKKKTYSNGTTEARTITKGLKEKEADDFSAGCGGCFALIVFLFLAIYTHWIVGLIIFLLLMVFISRQYYKE